MNQNITGTILTSIDEQAVFLDIDQEIVAILINGKREAAATFLV